MFKMLKSMRTVRKLIGTLFKSLAALAQVSSLLLLCFFVFAYAGVLLFGTVKKGCAF